MDVLKNEPFVWLDLEMSGLDPRRHTILEIACVVTDGDLKVLSEMQNIVIKHDQKVLQEMDKWCTEQHYKSGLLDQVNKSETSLSKAEEETLRFLKKFCKDSKSPLCGNSIWVDRLFLKKYMPKLEQFFHYRNIDVSSIKELAVRWAGLKFEKKESHRALDDVYESIEELKFYRNNFFKM